MDSFELNKIIAAVLMVVLLVIGLGKIADSVFHVKKPEKPGSGRIRAFRLGLSEFPRSQGFRGFRGEFGRT